MPCAILPLVRRQIQTEELTWIDMVDLSVDDLDFLRREFSFHPLDIAELQHRSPRPKVEEHPGYLMLVVHIPVFDGDSRSTMSAEVDMFVTKTHIITVHIGRVHTLDRFFRSVNEDRASRERYVGRGSAYLFYSVMSVLIEASFPKLDHINEKVDAAEQHIFSGNERAMVYELSALQRDLSGFRQILRPQVHLYDAGSLRGDFANPMFKPVFRSIDAKLARVWDALETLQEKVAQLAGTNATLVTHKLNEFIKVLTLLGAVFIPFGVVAQVILSINLDTPPLYFAIFWAIIGGMLIADFILLWYYRRHKLL